MVKKKMKRVICVLGFFVGCVQSAFGDFTLDDVQLDGFEQLKRFIDENKPSDLTEEKLSDLKGEKFGLIYPNIREDLDDVDIELQLTPEGAFDVKQKQKAGRIEFTVIIQKPEYLFEDLGGLIQMRAITKTLKTSSKKTDEGSIRLTSDLECRFAITWSQELTKNNTRPISFKELSEKWFWHLDYPKDVLKEESREADKILFVRKDPYRPAWIQLTLKDKKTGKLRVDSPRQMVPPCVGDRVKLPPAPTKANFSIVPGFLRAEPSTIPSTTSMPAPSASMEADKCLVALDDERNDERREKGIEIRRTYSNQCSQGIQCSGQAQFVYWKFYGLNFEGNLLLADRRTFDVQVSPNSTGRVNFFYPYITESNSNYSKVSGYRHVSSKVPQVTFGTLSRRDAEAADRDDYLHCRYSMR